MKRRTLRWIEDAIVVLCGVVALLIILSARVVAHVTLLP